MLYCRTYDYLLSLELVPMRQFFGYWFFPNQSTQCGLSLTFLLSTRVRAQVIICVTGDFFPVMTGFKMTRTAGCKNGPERFRKCCQSVKRSDLVVQFQRIYKLSSEQLLRWKCFQLILTNSQSLKSTLSFLNSPGFTVSWFKLSVLIFS